MNNLLLPRWLTPASDVRSGELLAELARFLARAASLEEAVRFACRRLVRFLDAEVAVLIALDTPGQRLESVAASSPEWELLGPVGLEALPEWQQAVDAARPVWSEHFLPTLLPGLDSPFALVLPVIGLGRPYGCFVVAFERIGTAPDEDDQEAAQAVAQLFAPQLEARRLRRELHLLDQRSETWQQLGEHLARSDFSPAALQRLLSDVVADLPLSAVGLFVRDTYQWRCLARAGAAGPIPDCLPLEFEQVDALASGDPSAVIPLGSRKDPAGLLLIRGPAAIKAGADRNQLSLLAGVALSQHQSRRRESSEDTSFLALFESLSESAFLLDSSGHLQEVNTAFCKITGLSAAELRHRPLSNFLRPAEVEAMNAWLQASPVRPFRLAVEWQAPPQAGRAYDLVAQPLASAAADRLLWVGFLRDTGEGAPTDDRARVAEACLEGVIDAVQDGVWLLDARGTIEAANQRLAQLLGVSPQDLGVGLPQSEILQTLKLNFARPDEACAAWRRLQEQPDQVAWDEVELLRPRRVLERFARPLLDAQQQLVGRLEVYRDVTDQRLPEDKLVQRERLATLGHLLSGLAHELNNPLTAVAGYAELLRGLRLTRPVKQKVDRLAEEAERAGRILKSVLLFARGDSQHKQSVNVVELLDHTLSLRAYELKVENIQVVREYEAGLPPVAANSTQLQQVLLNLLLNAEQAIRSQRQHGRITLRARRESDSGLVQIEIADDGPGIPAAVLPHIFETFFTTKPPAVGTGLGLSISQAIIRRHGGEIRAESRSGQGAVFRITLPLGTAVAAQPPALAPPPPPRRPASPRPGRRVLVVDDEPVVAHLIADTLRRQRFTVRVHTDSRRALAEASEKDFDLVVCDLRMPELDGPAFYRLLQERKPDLSRRLLFTTGDTLACDTSRFLEQVGLPNLAKPFHVDELTAAVGNVLRQLEKAAPGENKSQPQESRSRR